MEIRDATVADAEAIGEVHVRSWQATYRGVLPDDLLDSLDPAARGRMWAHRLVRIDGHAARVLVVADDHGGVVGFAAMGASGERRVGEVFAIYLLPDVIGVGIGRSLFSSAVDVLGSFGFGRAVLWVAAANVRARRFYEAAGWQADGERKVDESFGAPIVEVRYAHELVGGRSE